MLKGRRIFITGGAGFIANKLLAEILEDNEVVVFDNFSRDTLSQSPMAGHRNLRVVVGDVLDFTDVKQAMRGASVVVHAAAIAGVDTVILDPVRTMQVNMLGTANVLEAARVCGVSERFVDFSTSEVFGGMAFRSKEEDSAVSGSAGEARWTYAVSKLAGEHLAHAYHAQFGLPVVTVRPFNVYGPGQTGDGALHAFIQRALKGDTIQIDGDGSQIRAWCYVDDFITGLLACLTRPEAIGQSFNIGNARAVITVLGLAHMVCRVLKSDSDIVHTDALSADIAIRVPDVNKASSVLGFTAQVDLEEGIRRTAQWYERAS